MRTMSAPKTYRTTLQVRFGDVDAAGIAYYPRIYDMIHRAFENMWGDHVGIQYYDLVKRDGVGFPLAHSEVDFRSPLRFGDRPTVDISCFKVGRTSLGVHQVFRVGERVCVDARMTVVCVKLDGLVSTPIPEGYRAKFEELLEA